MRSGANGWKLRATTDSTKEDMISKGQTFLRKANILEIAVGDMKNDLHKPDLEKSWCRQNTKYNGAFGFMEKKPNPIKRGLKKVFPLCMDEDLIQIFIKMIGGRHYCIRLNKGMRIHELEKEIQIQLGTLTKHQNLIYTGHSLQDNHTFQHYGIIKDSTIILSLRLHGICNGASSKIIGSFRDAVKGKERMQNRLAPASELLCPYIVEQKSESPML